MSDTTQKLEKINVSLVSSRLRLELVNIAHDLTELGVNVDDNEASAEIFEKARDILAVVQKLHDLK